MPIAPLFGRKGAANVEYRLEYSGWVKTTDSPVDYIPVGKGLIRGDAGVSLRFKRPVAEVICPKNT